MMKSFIPSAVRRVGKSRHLTFAQRRFFRDAEPDFRKTASPELVALYDLYHNAKA
ncbi:MAG: hypothetical protein IJ770_03535 [Alphaproteobacteria bacterium]|nr:hypothetical protein [Alphaproteobacteria bacterium]